MIYADIVVANANVSDKANCSCLTGANANTDVAKANVMLTISILMSQQAVKIWKTCVVEANVNVLANVNELVAP